MLQVFEGIKAKNRYPGTHIVSRLGSFIIINNGYFRLLCLILTLCKGENWRANMDREVRKATIAGEIDASKVDEFKNMVEELYNSTQNKGKLMEYILSEVGPLSLNCLKDNCYNDCWIKKEDGGRINEKNFDVVFFNDFKCPYDLEVEMIESKVDLYTFLFAKPRLPEMPFVSDAYSKLSFFKQVRDYFCESNVCIAFATAKLDVTEGIAALNEAEYGWVKVFSGKDIEEKLKSYQLK